MIWERVGRMFFPEAAEPACLQAGAPMEGIDLLVPLLDELPGRFGVRAAERLREVVAGMRMMERVRADESLRKRIYNFYPHETLSWPRGPDDVRRLTLPPGTEGAVLGLLSGMPNGYVREAAVHRLALLGDGTELPPLLVRANDWVNPVRIRALDALRARLVPAYAEHWVPALPLVLRLRGTGRADARPLVDAVLELLARPGAAQAVWNGLHSVDRAVQRACFAILAPQAEPVRERLAFGSLGSDDLGLRIAAARLAAGLSGPALDRLLPHLLADGSGRVRMIGLKAAAEQMGRFALPELHAALLDRGPALRADARASIERLEPMDFAAFYRARLQPDGPRLAEAVAGIGETGAAEDAELVAPLVHHPRPRVRAAALRVLARLAGDAAVPVLAEALGDASPSVSRTAVDVLRPRVTRVEITALLAWLREPHPVHVRRNALSLLVMRGKWNGIAWILQACADGIPEVRAAGEQQLRWWRQRFNRSFAQPTRDQQEAVRAALANAGDALDAKTVKWLRFAAGIGG